jgi:hypothetical protein
MARPSLPPELKRSPFRATVSPQDSRWLEAHIGEARRWPSTTALLGDAIVLLRELEAMEGNVRQEFLRKQVEALRLAQQRSEGRAPLGPMPPTANSPEHGAATRRGFELHGPQGSLRVTPGPRPGPEAQASGPLRGGDWEEPPDWLEGSPSHEKLDPKAKAMYEARYKAAVAAQDWEQASLCAEALCRSDDLPRLVHENQVSGRVYQQGKWLNYYNPQGLLERSLAFELEPKHLPRRS